MNASANVLKKKFLVHERVKDNPASTKLPTPGSCTCSEKRMPTGMPERILNWEGGGGGGLQASSREVEIFEKSLFHVSFT